jgi:PAS domain S-box-containing protein
VQLCPKRATIMSKQSPREFLEERLAAVQAEAENYQMQADTALQYAEQVWWSWNIKRHRIKIRSVGECILGYGPADMERGDQFWWDLIHPEDRREVEESLNECFKSRQQVWRCEHRLKDVGGEWVWVEQAGFVHQCDADGYPVEMVGTTRKTQERYQLLDLFRGSETLIEAFAESAPIPFWVRDHEGVVLLCSEAMKTLFGYPDILESMEELNSPESMDAWREAFQAALRGDEAERRMRMRQKSGEEKVHAHHLIPLTQGQQTFAILEVFLPR